MKRVLSFLFAVYPIGLFAGAVAAVRLGHAQSGNARALAGLCAITGAVMILMQASCLLKRIPPRVRSRVLPPHP